MQGAGRGRARRGGIADGRLVGSGATAGFATRSALAPRANPPPEAIVALSLVTGPAHAGKVALLLEHFSRGSTTSRFSSSRTGPDVDRVERDLLASLRLPARRDRSARSTTLFAGSPRATRSSRPVVDDAQRALVVRRAVARSSGARGLPRRLASPVLPTRCSPRSRSSKARSSTPRMLDGDLARSSRLPGRARPARALGPRDAPPPRQRALAGDLDAWQRRARLRLRLRGSDRRRSGLLLEALAGRADVEVSLPYEPGRAVFASLRGPPRISAALAGGRIEELAASLPRTRRSRARPPRADLFEPARPQRLASAGAVRFLAGAGTAGTLELVARRCSGCSGPARRRSRSRSSCPSIEQRRALARDGLLGLRDPVR